MTVRCPAPRPKSRVRQALESGAPVRTIRGPNGGASAKADRPGLDSGPTPTAQPPRATGHGTLSAVLVRQGIGRGANPTSEQDT